MCKDIVRRYPYKILLIYTLLSSHVRLKTNTKRQVFKITLASTRYQRNFSISNCDDQLHSWTELGPTQSRDHFIGQYRLYRSSPDPRESVWNSSVVYVDTRYQDSRLIPMATIRQKQHLNYLSVGRLSPLLNHT